jgi:hypothetical protein
MGVGVFLVYFPVYIILLIYIGFKVNKINQSISSEQKGRARYKLIILGFLLSIFLTWTSILFVPLKGSFDYLGFAIRVGLTLVAPLVLLEMSKILSSILKGSFKIKGMQLSLGVCYSIVAMPWITIVALRYYYPIVNFPQYYSLCSKAHITYYSKVDSVKSVFLSPDLFEWAPPRYQSSKNKVGDRLLIETNLKFVEREVVDEEVTTIEKIVAVPVKNSKGTGKVEFESSKISRIESEYKVEPKIITVPDSWAKGLGGAIIEVRRIDNGELIASTEYYWDNKNFRACPSESHRHEFITNFIRNALGLSSKEVSVWQSI